MTKTRLLAVASAFLASSIVMNAVAEKRKPPLTLGSLTGEVITQWGEPQERIERGVRNDVVWRYPGGAFVVFKQGKVESYKVSGGDIVDAHTERAAVQAQQTVAAMPTSEIAGATRDLVRDIARELPSSPDAPYSDPPPESGSSRDTVRTGPRQPAPPPPAMVPGNIEEELDEEE